MKTPLARFGHYLTALPALLGLVLDKTGNLSGNMHEIVSVLVLMFGASHVATIMHSSKLEAIETTAKGAAATLAAQSSNAERFMQNLSGLIAQTVGSVDAIKKTLNEDAPPAPAADPAPAKPAAAPDTSFAAFQAWQASQKAGVK